MAVVAFGAGASVVGAGSGRGWPSPQVAQESAGAEDVSRMVNEAWPFLMRMPNARALEKSLMEMRIPPPESGLRTAAAPDAASRAIKEGPAMPAGGAADIRRENEMPSGSDTATVSPT